MTALIILLLPVKEKTKPEDEPEEIKNEYLNENEERLTRIF